MLTKNIRFLVKKLKEVPPQSWVIKPEDATKKFTEHDLSHLNIKYHRDIKKQYSRKRTDQALQPISALKGPIKVENPKIHDKIYRWCSCGNSLKQPFCDGSHLGTDFKPYKFTIEEKVKQIHLCGCKLTNKKPFCDGQSCKKFQETQSKSDKI